MKRFRGSRFLLCLAAVLALAVSVCAAEEPFTAEDRAADLTEQISIHRPELAGGGDPELLRRINERILEDVRMREYLERATALMSVGSLKVEWKGGVLGDVFSCAVSASGALEESRNTHAWTAANVDLRDGHEIILEELFTNGEAGREKIEAYLTEAVEPELSAHLEHSELLPLPDTFFMERAGLTLLYPIERLSTLGDRAGDIRIPWNALRDELDLSEDSMARRIGADGMITLTEESAEKLRAMAAEGSLTDIPAKLGDSMQELTDRYHTLTDPDGFEDGRLFALEGGCFRNVFLITDDLSRDWAGSRVEGIRMNGGCLWGLCVGETRREDWIAALGEPDGTAEIGEEKAEAIRLEPGMCDYYSCGENQLRLYSNGDGTLISIVLTE